MIGQNVIFWGGDSHNLHSAVEDAKLFVLTNEKGDSIGMGVLVAVQVDTGNVAEASVKKLNCLCLISYWMHQRRLRDQRSSSFSIACQQCVKIAYIVVFFTPLLLLF